MTIGHLAHAGLMDVPRTGSELGSSTTLAFAIDAEYLLPFRVMIASMARLGTLSECPIALYTLDERIKNDPFVSLVVDHFRLIDGPVRETLMSMATHNVQRAERATWNRGTFLKWAVFEEQETEDLLFLDVDMLALQAIEPLLGLALDVPFVCCPQFQRREILEETDFRDKAVAHALRALLEGQFTGGHARRVNSGMMLVRQPLLRKAFFDELVTFVGEKVDLHEQGHLSSYFKQNSGMRCMVSSKYNFQENYLGNLDAAETQALLDEVAILHFAGTQKPWQTEAEPNRRTAWSLWAEASDQADRIMDMLQQSDQRSYTPPLGMY